MFITRKRYWLIAGLILLLFLLTLVWRLKSTVENKKEVTVKTETLVQPVDAEKKPEKTASSEPVTLVPSHPLPVENPNDEFVLPLDKLLELLPAGKNQQVDLKYPDGQKKIQGNIKDGKPTGLWRNWYANGQLALEMSWKKGLPNGKTRSWYSNGYKRGEIFFVDGKAEGRWQRWYVNGQIKQDMRVHKGVVQTMTKWDDQGHLIADLAVHDNQVSGVVLSWYDSGEKRSESVFEKNELVRKTEWDEEGNIVDLGDN